MPKQEAPTEQFMTIKQLGLLLNTSARNIYYMIYNNQIPYIRLGIKGRYRFNKQDVMNQIKTYSSK